MNENLARNFFSNIPVEFNVPRHAQVVFVADFFLRDLSGGAELTTEALIKTCPRSVARIHSASLSPELIEKNKTKQFVVCNFSQASKESLECLTTLGGVNYTMVEYDFKLCRARSFLRHTQETGKPCDCMEGQHGNLIRPLFLNAKHVAWMSARQRDVYYHYIPDLATHSNHVLSSVFDAEALAQIRALHTSTKKDHLWSYLHGGSSWIKGAQQTAAWLQVKRLPGTEIPNLPYDKFLGELARHQGFAFRPLDYDTCPRVVIEAKLLGCNLHLNSNVLHSNEPWFAGSVGDTEAYLSQNAQDFWRRVLL